MTGRDSLSYPFGILVSADASQAWGAMNRCDTVWCVPATPPGSSSKLADQVCLTEHKTLARALDIEAEVPLQHLIFAIKSFSG